VRHWNNTAKNIRITRIHRTPLHRPMSATVSSNDRRYTVYLGLLVELSAMRRN